MARLTEGSVSVHLVRMSLPMIVGIFAMMTFSLVDTWFVAKLGTAELAAISFTFPVIMVISAVSIGLGAGTSSIVARAIGRGNWPRVQRLATDGLVLGGLTGIVLSIVGFLTIDSLFRLLGANEATLPLIRDYMQIWYFGAVFLLIPMIGMSSIRATGDTKLPSLLMIGAAILNLILDPLLIFGIGPFPRLELEGAAIASLIARVVSLFGAIAVMHFKLNMLTRHLQSAKDLISSWKEITHVGLPAAGTNAIIPIATGFATALIATYGQAAVAGFGVATRVEAVVLIMFYALSAVIGPFAGQNLGAGHKDRILEALRLCTIFSLASGVVIAALLAVFGDSIARLFDPQQSVVDVAVTYFYLVPLSYGTAAMVMIMNACFNGLGQPLPAVAVSVARMIGIFLPLAWLGSYLFGLAGIFAALAAANALCGVGAYIWVRSTIIRRPMEANSYA